MPSPCPRPAWFLAAAMVGAGLCPRPTAAQAAPREAVVPVENVRYDYAQVLAVRPVYQILRATSTERVCDMRDDARGNRLSRVVNAVRDRLGSGSTTNEERDAGLENCRTEPVVKEFRRTIAYDVDYMYRGSKFRTRMDRDPGNRLRIRISISPQPFD